MGVAIQDLRSRVLGPESNDLVSQQFVVSLGDLVQLAQAAMAIVFRLGATVEGEHGGDASQRRQVHHQNGICSGHEHCGEIGRRVVHRSQQFLSQITSIASANVGIQN